MGREGKKFSVKKQKGKLSLPYVCGVQRPILVHFFGGFGEVGKRAEG